MERAIAASPAKILGDNGTRVELFGERYSGASIQSMPSFRSCQSATAGELLRSGRSADSTPAANTASTDALAAAANFLIAGQRADGAWTDFDLEPGASDSWVTASVALALHRAAPRLGGEQGARAEAAVGRAVGFLLAAGRADPDGRSVWGYNGRVPPDAGCCARAGTRPPMRPPRRCCPT